MSFWLYSLIKLVHVLAMAVWLGGSIVAPLGIRRAMKLGQPHTRELIARLEGATVAMISAALCTIASGGLLIHLAGGWSSMPARILVGAALTPLIFVLGGAGSRPLLQKLRAHFAAGGDSPSAEPMVRRFLVVINLELALRLAILALMILPIS